MDTRSYLLRARCHALLCVGVLICTHASYVHAASTVAGNTCFQLTGLGRAGGGATAAQRKQRRKSCVVVALPERRRGSEVKVNKVFSHGTCAVNGECASVL